MHQYNVGRILFRQIQLKYEEVKPTTVQFSQRSLAVSDLDTGDVFGLNERTKRMSNHATLMCDEHAPQRPSWNLNDI